MLEHLYLILSTKIAGQLFVIQLRTTTTKSIFAKEEERNALARASRVPIEIHEIFDKTKKLNNLMF